MSEPTFMVAWALYALPVIEATFWVAWGVFVILMPLQFIFKIDKAPPSRGRSAYYIALLIALVMQAMTFPFVFPLEW